MSTSIFQDVSIGVSLAVELPAAIALLKAELPNLEAEGKALWTAVLAPAEALITDAKVVFKGGSASVEVANGQKSLQDAGDLFTALVAAFPTAKADLSAEYGKLVPAFQPIATTLGIALPAAIFVPAAPAPAPAAASAGA